MGEGEASRHPPIAIHWFSVRIPISGEASERRPWASKRDDRPKVVPNPALPWPAAQDVTGKEREKFAGKQLENPGGKNRDPLHHRKWEMGCLPEVPFWPRVRFQRN